MADLIEGIYALSQSNEVYPVNIGNPAEMSVLQFAETIRDRCGSTSEIIFKPLPVDDPKIRQPNITRAKEILKWSPKVSLDQGLETTIAYFRSLIERGEV
jgi:dTDP-glucose 4,6-dehydratase